MEEFVANIIRMGLGSPWHSNQNTRIIAVHHRELVSSKMLFHDDIMPGFIVYRVNPGLIETAGCAFVYVPLQLISLSIDIM